MLIKLSAAECGRCALIGHWLLVMISSIATNKLTDIFAHPVEVCGKQISRSSKHSGLCYHQVVRMAVRKNSSENSDPCLIFGSSRCRRRWSVARSASYSKCHFVESFPCAAGRSGILRMESSPMVANVFVSICPPPGIFRSSFWDICFYTSSLLHIWKEKWTFRFGWLMLSPNRNRITCRLF